MAQGASSRAPENAEAQGTLAIGEASRPFSFGCFGRKEWNIFAAPRALKIQGVNESKRHAIPQNEKPDHHWPVFNAAYRLSLQTIDTQHLEDVFLVDRFRRTLLHLADEVFRKRSSPCAPICLLEPGNVARRDLRQRHEGRAGVAHVRQADRVPGAFLIRLFAVDTLWMLCTIAVTMDSIM